VVPHGILLVFNTILYENEFQNPQIFQQTISLFPEHSTLVVAHFDEKITPYLCFPGAKQKPFHNLDLQMVIQLFVLLLVF
jgi:hypothetical protein